MTEPTIEQEIQAKADKAPRVKPADIEEEIVSEVYFTAADGIAGGRASATGHVKSEYVEGVRLLAPCDLLTICVLVLRNGFTVTGASACASPENFDAEINRRIAKANAVEKVWPLLGFRLRDKLHAQVRCQGERCMATTQNGVHHSRECLEEAGRDQGWTPTSEELAAAGPSAPDPADFALGKACDLSGEGGCEACQ